MSIPGEEKLYEQRTLFSVDPAPAKKPGDLSFEEWSKRPDIAFHGTSTQEYDSPFNQSYLHMGTQQSAEDRLFGRGGPTKEHTNPDSGGQPFEPSYIDYDTDPDLFEAIHGHHPEEITGNESLGEQREGPFAGNLSLDDDYWGDTVDPRGDFRVKPFRLHDVMQGEQFSDMEANQAHMVAAGMSGATVSPGIMQSAFYNNGEGNRVTQKIHDLADQVTEGKSLPYKNALEDPGSTSFLVPRFGGASSWEDDVVNNSNRSERQKAFMASRGHLEGEMSPIKINVGTQQNFNTQQFGYKPAEQQLTASIQRLKRDPLPEDAEEDY